MLAVLLSGAFMNVFDFFSVDAAIPSLHRDLHASPAALELILGGYGLMYSLGLVTGGRLGDRFGRRRMLRIGMAAFACASAAAGCAPNVSSLVVARLAEGLAAAIVMPQVLAMIRVTFAPAERRVAFGLLGATIAVGQASGQVLGGLLLSADLFGEAWRPILFVNVVVATFGLLAGIGSLPESRAAERPRLDLVGMANLMLAAALLLVPLVVGREAGWPWWCVASMAAAVPAGAAFVALERRRGKAGVHPLVDLRLFRHREFAVGLCLNVSLYATLNAFFFFLALFLQDGRSEGPLAAALSFLPVAVGNLATSVASSGLVRRFGHDVLTAGAALQGAGLLLVLVLAGGATTHDSLALEGGLLLFGLGQGLLIPTIVGVVLGRVRGGGSGAASGVLVMTQQLFGTVGLVVVSVAFFGVLGSATSAGAYAGAFRRSLVFELGFVALTFVASRGIVGRGDAAGEPGDVRRLRAGEPVAS